MLTIQITPRDSIQNTERAEKPSFIQNAVSYVKAHRYQVAIMTIAALAGIYGCYQMCQPLPIQEREPIFENDPIPNVRLNTSFSRFNVTTPSNPPAHPPLPTQPGADITTANAIIHKSFSAASHVMTAMAYLLAGLIGPAILRHRNII